MARKPRQGKAVGFQGLLATRERRQHDGGVITELIAEQTAGKAAKRRHRARFSCILDHYLWHGVLDKIGYNAGLRFQREYFRSILGIKVDDHGAGSNGDPDMRVISAINGNQRLRAAYGAMSRKQWQLMVAVCVENHAAGGTRNRRYLQQALQALARLWRITQG